MADAPFLRPDVLVLAAGGVLGEAWMTGVLAGIERESGVDLRGCDHFVGTSAGSIVAATLASGARPRQPTWLAEADANVEDAEEAPPRFASALLNAAGRGLSLTAPLVPPAMRVTAPAGRLLRAALLAPTPGGRDDLEGLGARIARRGARFDGRLRVVCVDRRSGRRVVFGSPGAPRATVAEAVQASCSIPWVFRPVEIDGREYVDGGAWSLTNLDVAPAGRGTEVLCLNVTGRRDAPLGSTLGALAAFSRSTASVETLALRARGARVAAVTPDDAAAAALGPNLMNPRRGRDVLAAGYRQGRALAS
jgi:NTE family protein